MSKIVNKLKNNYVLIFLFGLVVGLFIGSLLHLTGEQFGSIAEWVAGIATSASVITSLHLASRKNPNVKVYHSFEYQVNKETKRIVPKSLYIVFFVYNHSDKAIKLQFYGLRKRERDTFLRLEEYKSRMVEPGESLSYKFLVDDLERDFDLKNYTRKVQVAFAEPDGTLYTEKFKWGKFRLKYKLGENK